MPAGSYNAVSQLASVTSDDGTQYVASTTYNAQGQVTEQRLDSGANGFTRQSVYNPSTLRLETLKAGNAAPFENLQKLAYAYDLAGNITSLTDATNSNQTQTFGYDWLDRLTTAATNAVGLGQYSHTYAYNAIGNPSTALRTGYHQLQRQRVHLWQPAARRHRRVRQQLRLRRRRQPDQPHGRRGCVHADLRL